MEAICCVYEGKDTFLWPPTSLGKSVHNEVLPFACSTTNKMSWVQARVPTVLSLLASLTIAKSISMYTTTEYPDIILRKQAM